MKSLGKTALKAAVLVGASSIALCGAAFAQSGDHHRHGEDRDAPRSDASDVSGVTVQGSRPVVVGRLPQPIELQPQTIHEIDPEMMRQQAVTTLDQAVRNVPGITANTGEGGGATAGDQFRIRGFDAQNDIASDGLRDFGVYTRDAFDVESVQVFLGPSGATFGRGSFGGAINSSSKFAQLDDYTIVQGSVGSAELMRATLDANRQIGETSAVRINLLGHHNAVADIDNVESDRWGAAIAAGFGIGTDTSFEINYFHQTDNRTPYYGVPVSTPTGQTIARPLPVDRSSFYGTNLDQDDTTADVLTAKFMHAFNDSVTIRNDTRFGMFGRDFMAVAPTCSNAAASSTAVLQNCATNFFDNNPATIPQVTRGGANAPYSLDQWGVQNITTLIANFETGAFKHQLVTGLDFAYENAQRLNRNSYRANASTTFPRPTTNALNPDPTWSNAAFVAVNKRKSDSWDAAFFASEQLWLTEQFSVLAGVRWDQYNINSDLVTFGTVNTTIASPSYGAFTATNPNTVASSEVNETLFSPRVSLIWEPGDNIITYISWAKSEQPPTGTSIASVGTPVTDTQSFLAPTTSETIEAGVRFPLFTPRLLLGLSVFDTKRDNSQQTDATGSLVSSGDSQRVTGAEINLTGSITDRWTIEASYTYLDTETDAATIACVATVGSPIVCPVGGIAGTTLVSNTPAIGKPIPFAAENAATLWTTYQATDALQLAIGGRYTEAVWLNNTSTAQAPEYFSLDAAAMLTLSPTFTLQLNATNLTDREDNFDQVVGGRAAHAPGRTFVLSATKRF